jgi:hypothetical protein
MREYQPKKSSSSRSIQRRQTARGRGVQEEVESLEEKMRLCLHAPVPCGLIERWRGRKRESGRERGSKPRTACKHRPRHGHWHWHWGWNWRHPVGSFWREIQAPLLLVHSPVQTSSGFIAHSLSLSSVRSPIVPSLESLSLFALSSPSLFHRLLLRTTLRLPFYIRPSVN